MRTLTIKSGGGGGNFTDGWNTAEISNAKYGEWEGNKYLDIFFKDFPETLNMRVYSKKGKTGEEFAIGRVFRFANAGLTESLEGDDGTKVVKIDDSPEQLTGKNLNVFLFKDGEYFRILSQPAPTEFSNVVESFKDNDVSYWKGKAEKYYNDYIKKDNTDSDDPFGGMPN
tara:strand:- start:218 stop:727 length:510 start_codon:yes stop_codon:yes gene_type:complete